MWASPAAGEPAPDAGTSKAASVMDVPAVPYAVMSESGSVAGICDACRYSCK